MAKDRDALETIRLRNNFYRDNYRKVVSALLVSVIAVIALTCAVVYLVMNRPAPTYFATTDQGRLIPIIPLNRPVMTKLSIERWATNAATQAYSFDFINYRQQLQTASKYFTDNAWKDYINKLKSSGNLDAVTKRKLIITSVPGGAAVIENEGLLDGRYAWRIQMPLLATFRSSSEVKYQNAMMVTMLIVRVSTAVNPEGIAIAQINYTQQ